jgi:Dolichyl-phosphate-mannose-protein mannosyltransferase
VEAHDSSAVAGREDPRLADLVRTQPLTAAVPRPRVPPETQMAGLDALLALATPAPAKPPGWHRQLKRLGATLTTGPWPLIGILALQAVLSLRLVWSIGAYGDEGLYIWAGHLEWAHWLYGTPTPDFGAYFSGAPGAYPPLAALADSAGGLTAVRLLSLAFILSSTCLLYMTTRRVFSKRAALYAAAIFASTGASQFLGAFATYDTMALCILGVAVWAGVRAADCGPLPWRLAILALTGGLLALAAATKYVNLLFEPVAIALIGAQTWRAQGSFRAGIAAVAVSAITMVAALIGGWKLFPSYHSGIIYTTLSRQQGSFPVKGILFVAAGWEGAVMLCAIIGAVAIFCAYSDWATRLLAAALVAAGVIIPAAAAHSHLFVSMFKHVGYGEWFASIPAGYALASLLRVVPKVKMASATRFTLVVVAVMGMIGFALAGNHFTNIGPNFWDVERPLLQSAASYNRPVIAADDVNVAQYYVSELLPRATLYGMNPDPQWAAADPAEFLTYRGAGGDTAIAEAINAGYFTEVLISNFPLWEGKDMRIQQELRESGRYRLAAAVPYEAEGLHLVNQMWVRDGVR